MIDETTRLEMDKVVRHTLKKARIAGPPVKIEPLLEYLGLHRGFYDLQNPDLLDRAKHKIRVGGTVLAEIVRKIKLMSVLLPDEKRIIVDAGLPKIKRDWPSFHEASHKIFEWHRPFFFGDTAQTLDPVGHEVLENEANYGASALMFCGSVFSEEASRTIPCWASVEELKKRYGKSYQMTLRRYVEHGPDHTMAMLVSTPSWEDKPEDQPGRWRHFAWSPQFEEIFSTAQAATLLGAVDMHALPRRGGPVADFNCFLKDDDGNLHEFHGESFFNGYDLLTLFVHKQKSNHRNIGAD